jgi:hypothetical protein
MLAKPRHSLSEFNSASSNQRWEPRPLRLLMGSRKIYLCNNHAKKHLEKGVSLDFANDGGNVYINIHCAGETAAELENLPGWKQLDLSKTDYSGKFDSSIATGFNPTKLLGGQLEDVIDMATLFRVKSEGCFLELHHLLNTVQVLIRNLGLLPQKETNMICSALNVLTCMRNLCFEFKYDPTVLRNTAKEVLGASGHGDTAKGFMSGNQEMAKGMIPMAQGMVLPMLSAFATPEMVKAVNFNHYEVFLIIPKARLHWRGGFTINGLTDFLNEHLLSQM